MYLQVALLYQEALPGKTACEEKCILHKHKCFLEKYVQTGVSNWCTKHIITGIQITTQIKNKANLEESYRVSSDKQRGRHKEQLLPLPYILQSNQSPLPNFHFLYRHLLRRKPRIRQPFLQSRSVLQGVNVAAPRNLLRHRGLGAVGRGDRALNWVSAEIQWERLECVDFVLVMEGGEESCLQNS